MNQFIRHSLFSIVMFVSISSLASVPRHGFTPEQSAEMTESNKLEASRDLLSNLFGGLNGLKRSFTEAGGVTVPYAEYSQAGYVIFSDETVYNAGAAKRAMAQNLPADITLVVFTGNASKSYQQNLFNEYAQYRDSSRLKVIYLPEGGRGFWARDGIPVPVWTNTGAGEKQFTVVDARYYHYFEADKEVSEFFGANLLKHNYYYEGGNYAANSRGDCIVVNNTRVEKIPTSVFREQYGCQTLVRLPHTKGIGHIDESVKFMDDNTLLVDDEAYANTLTEKGFNVVRMIRPQNGYETYVNALVVNGTAFVPVFNQSGDATAISLYESFGLKVVPVDSISLSNDGLGSIHCITMSYPPVPFNDLLNHIGAQDMLN